MALVVKFVNTEGFDATVQDLDNWTLYTKATAGNLAALALINKQPQIVAEATTTDNTAASEVIDLDDKGVTWPTSHRRRIRLISEVRTDNDQYFQEWEQFVLGGTTPVLMGSPRLINAWGVIATAVVHYGVCHAVANYDSSDTAILTAVAGSTADGSTAGSSIGNISTNTATLTHPLARAAGKRILGVNASPDVATASEALQAGVFPINSTTMSIFTADTATPSADGFDDDGRIDVSFYILPPPSVALVMNSTHVEVHAGTDATDAWFHRIKVFIDRAEPIDMIAD